MQKDDATNHAGADVPITTLLDAGSIPPSPKHFIVTNPHGHDFLKAGDEVVLVADTTINYFLLRTADMTLHTLKDNADQYVHLEESSNPSGDARTRTSTNHRSEE